MTLQRAFLFATVGLLFNCNGQAQALGEPLNVGPVDAKLVLYGVPIALVGLSSVSIKTTSSTAHVALDGRISLDGTKAPAELMEIAKAVLPLTLSAGPCAVDVQSLDSANLSITGYTAEFDGIVKVNGCLTFSDQVNFSIRFVPTVDKASVAMRVVSVQLQVPLAWRIYPGEQKLARIVKERIEDQKFQMPKLEHVRAAFQGASFGSKQSTLFLRIRLDALLDGQAIVNLLPKADQANQLIITYP